MCFVFFTISISIEICSKLLQYVVQNFNTTVLRVPVLNEPRHEKNRLFAYAKTKTQISFAVTAKLISAFVFATRIIQSLLFLYTKFQASSHLVKLYSLVYVGPGRKPRRPVFSARGSFLPARLAHLVACLGLRFGKFFH